jgi:hypothetical protein
MDLLGKQRIVTNDVANLGKYAMLAFQKYYKLQVQLEGKLSVALKDYTDRRRSTPPLPKKSCRGCTRVPSTIDLILLCFNHCCLRVLHDACMV